MGVNEVNELRPLVHMLALWLGALRDDSVFILTVEIKRLLLIVNV